MKIRPWAKVAVVCYSHPSGASVRRDTLRFPPECASKTFQPQHRPIAHRSRPRHQPAASSPELDPRHRASSALDRRNKRARRMRFSNIALCEFARCAQQTSTRLRSDNIFKAAKNHAVNWSPFFLRHVRHGPLATSRAHWFQTPILGFSR